MPRKILRLLLALAAIFALAMLALIVFTAGGPPAHTALPNPNGYDDFLKAASRLNGKPGDAPNLDHDGLRALVSTNGETLRLIRLGLGRQCALDTESAVTNLSGTLSDLGTFKRLAQLLVAEGRLAEMEDRRADAAQSYVETIRFGNEMSRGGFLICRMVGIACEMVGFTPLSKLAPRLKPEEAHRVMLELERSDETAIPWSEVLRNERRLTSYELRKGFNPVTWVGWVMNLRAARRVSQSVERKHERAQTHIRLLVAELALRCCRSEQGRPPNGLEELVPTYLRRVPADPFSGRPMVYRLQGTNWLLYSVGEDRADDGGMPAGRSLSSDIPKGDIFYDSPF